MTTVLLLHPGAMGSSLGSNLIENGHQVLWVAEHRSVTTVARATADQLTRAETLGSALPRVEVVLSVCPPKHAVEVGQLVAECGFGGVYCDANAISPQTAQSLLNIFGENYVDGGIVGPPARQHGRTRLYLSGPKATKLASLFDSTQVRTAELAGEHLAASAMKMCYAAYTKGTAALILGIRALAEHYGVSDALREEWSQSQNSLWDRSEQMGPGTSLKAWRFAPEMREIAKTFDDVGLPSGFHEAAAEIYARMATLKEQRDVPTSTVVQSLLQGSDDID